MKFTSEDLMKMIGLQIGDRVKIKFEVSNIIDENITTEERIVNIVSDNNWGVGLEHDGVVVPIERLLNKHFEILPKIKKIGDLRCNDFFVCFDCPLRFLCECGFSIEPAMTLSENLEKIGNFEKKDLEIYDLLLTRLDKEVK